MMMMIEIDGDEEDDDDGVKCYGDQINTHKHCSC